MTIWAAFVKQETIIHNVGTTNAPLFRKGFRPVQATFSVSKRGSVAVGLAACATARATSAQLALLRKDPGLPADKTLTPGFLKNSDDQTVLALVAVSRAMRALNQATVGYQDWGIVAAANLYGRAPARSRVCSTFAKTAPGEYRPI